MTMDILFIEAVVRELNETLRGAAIAKIHQPGPSEIVFRLWTGRRNVRLLLSAATGSGRIHLTDSNFPNPPSPPRFCQLLRSRLSRLLEIDRPGNDRIVRILFSGEGESRWNLILELAGTHPNLVLLDSEELIIDALHRVETGGREVAPGLHYSFQERPARFDLTVGSPTVPEVVPFRSWLLRELTPMTPLVADDLDAAVTCGISREASLEAFRRRWRSGEFCPFVARRDEKLLLSVYMPDFVELKDVRFFESPSLAADYFYGDSTNPDIFLGGKRELETIVRKGIGRLNKRQGNILAERESAADYERQKEIGELLLANMHSLRRGMKEARLLNWFADPPEEIVVPLDPAISPQENAERYFRKHRKGKRGLSHMERRMAETHAEIEWLEGVALALEGVRSAEELNDLRRELREGGYIRKNKFHRVGVSQADPMQLVRTARTPGGLTIYWGKNNRGNDYVSKRMATTGDLWFHAYNIPGTHLVLKGGERAPEEDLLHAAAVAAAYSRGRNDAKVEVIVTDPKNVRKQKGARPGLVTVERYRTVVVRPLEPEEGAPT